MRRLGGTAVTAFICLLVAASLTAPFASAAGGLTPPPISVAFGSQDIHTGQTPSTQVNFLNTSGGDLFLTGAAITGTDSGDFSVQSNGCVGLVADSQSCDVYVQFDPGTVGAKAADLEVTDGLGTTSVPLTGTGETGTLTGSPPTFNPQPWFYGSQSQQANIANNSSYQVTGMNATIAGPDAAFFSIDFNGCQFTLGQNNNCSIGVRFNPTGPGTKNAQLEFTNDGTVSPLVIPLTATALNGPSLTVTPPSRAFGPVEVGTASAPQVFTLGNNGDFPLQIQQLLVLSATPQLFATSADGCSLNVINPGSTCQVSATFTPDSAGDRAASLYVISNQQGPVGTIQMTGTGVSAPDGAPVVTGDPASGNTVTCSTDDYPEGTTFAYAWLGDGDLISGESAAQLGLGDSDVGKRLACRVTATNPVGTRTATSAQTPPVGAQDLSKVDGSLVDSPVCRGVSAPGSISAGGTRVTLTVLPQVTPSSPLRLEADGKKLAVTIDGQAVASGNGRTSVPPRTLARFADGPHTLAVSAGSAEGSASIALSPCRLAVLLDGGPKRSSSVTVSGAAGLTKPRVELPGSLRIGVSKGRVGRASIRVAGEPAETFPLFGGRTASNGVVVRLQTGSITVTGLPADTAVVGVTLSAGVLHGRPGTVRASALLRGDTARSNARSGALWRG